MALSMVIPAAARLYSVFSHGLPHLNTVLHLISEPFVKRLYGHVVHPDLKVDLDGTFGN